MCFFHIHFKYQYINIPYKQVFPKIRVPQNEWFIMENPIEMDDLGGKPHYFWKHPYRQVSFGDCGFSSKIFTEDLFSRPKLGVQMDPKDISIESLGIWEMSSKDMGEL